MTNQKSIDETLKRIHALRGNEIEQLPWLRSLLDTSDATVRLAALNALVHRFDITRLSEKLLSMLDTEADDDVLLVVISALSAQHCGSKDSALIKRCQEAVGRLGGSLEGTREALDDAKLRVMLGRTTVQIVKMSHAQRSRELAAANATLTV